MDGPPLWKLAYRIPEVAYLLSMSISKVKQLIRRKELKHVKVDGATLVTRRRLREYLRSIDI